MAKSEASPIRVGVAGWDYKDWHGVLYPRPAPRDFDPLRFLAGYVDLIEINSTFYRPARAEYAKRWVDRVAALPDFQFTAKLWRRFTHERDTAWSAEDVRAVKTGLQPLARAGRLGAVLVQFPWSFTNDAANREWLEDVLDAFRAFPLVLEVRHASWNERGFYMWLSERGVGIVNIDQPLFRRSVRPAARSTGRVGYVRVHGRNYKDWFRKGAGRDARYDYLYSMEELRPWANRAREIARDEGTEVVDVVFNNHYRAQAVVNALQFKHLLTRRKSPAPPTLLEEYGDSLGEFARPAADAA